MLKRHWCELKTGSPGHRFKDRYERIQERREEKPALLRWLKPMIALAIVGVGVVFCITPGPGIPLILVGAMLLAEHSLALARMLDWLEVRARKVFERARSSWRKTSPVVKNGAVVIAMAIVAAVGYGAYQVVFRQ